MSKILNYDDRSDLPGGSNLRKLLSISTALHDAWLIARCTLESGIRDETANAKVILIKPTEEQRRRSRHMWTFGIILAGLAIARPASARDAEVITPVELFDPERGDGITLGSAAILYPQLNIDGTYDDNIYNLDGAEIDDLVGSFRPRATIRANTARHEFVVRGGADIRRYADISDENSEQFDVSAQALLDFASRTELVLDTGYQRGIEQRGTSGDQFLTDSPVEYDRLDAGFVLRRQGGFLEIMAEGRLIELDYNDASINGVPLDLSERDVSIGRGRVRASAPSSDHTRIFIEAGLNRVSYEQTAISPRDSDGYSLLAGMELQLSELVDIEVGAGYIQQSYDDPNVENTSEINFSLLVDWTPQPDWQITAAARRQVDPSPRIDVPAIIRSEFSLEGRKAFGDRLLATVRAGLVDEDYKGDERQDTRFFASVSAHYRLTPNVGVVTRLGWRNQDGGSFGRNYDGVSATVGLRIRA